MVPRGCWFLAGVVLCAGPALAGDHRADWSLAMSQSAGGGDKDEQDESKRTMRRLSGAAAPAPAHHLGGQVSGLKVFKGGVVGRNGEHLPHPWSWEVNTAFDRSFDRAYVTVGMRYTHGFGRCDSGGHPYSYWFVRVLPFGRRFASGDQARGALSGGIGVDTFPSGGSWGLRTQIDVTDTRGSAIVEHPLRLSVGVTWRLR